MNRAAFRRHRYRALAAALVVFALLLALIYRGPLVAWFSGAPTEGRAETATSQAPSRVDAEGSESRAAREGVAADTPSLPPQQFSEQVLVSLRTAFDAYEEIRARLAADTLEEVAPRAERVLGALRSAAQSTRGLPRVQETLEEGAEAAQKLTEANELDGARLAFGELSRALIALGGADPRLSDGWSVFECPMTQGYSKWMQRSDQLMNPYMGQRMLSCGSEAEWRGGPAELEPQPHAVASSERHAHAVGEIAYYTCPMHPSVKQPGPGACPICGMDLTPVTRQEVESGVIIIDAARRQLIGVKTAQVERRSIEKTIRTVGEVTYDEARLVDVSTKFSGWIEELYADSIGVRVKKGQTLFTVYSPQLYAAQQELLIASSRDRGPSAAGLLLDSAKRRLKLWDVPSRFIDQVLETRKAVRNVPIVAPATGFVIEKNVVEGSAIEPGARLFRIANLDKIWIEAELYESELPLVTKGQEAVVTLPYLPGTRFTGRVTFVYPYLSGETRTGQVRIELDNQDLELKPDMYATVELVTDRGERLVVPESAVIYAGPRRLVFIDLGEGRLRPQEIEVGIKTDDAYEVLSGLRSGDTVVTSGNFLVAAESRLKSAEGAW